MMVNKNIYNRFRNFLNDAQKENLKNTTINYIFELACNFRNAIETARLSNDPVFKDFPTAACGDTSILLATYLEEHGIETKYISAISNDSINCWCSHAWLRHKDKVIIDITADQFKSEREYKKYSIPVYVGYEDEFHRLFCVVEERKNTLTDEQNTNPVQFGRLQELYNKIKFCLAE